MVQIFNILLEMLHYDNQKNSKWRKLSSQAACVDSHYGSIKTFNSLESCLLLSFENNVYNRIYKTADVSYIMVKNKTNGKNCYWCEKLINIFLSWLFYSRN